MHSPIALAIAAILAGTAQVAIGAPTPTFGSPAWFAQSRGAVTPTTSNSGPGGQVLTPSGQPFDVHSLVSKSMANLDASAKALVVQTGIQNAARFAALQGAKAAPVPDGIGVGALNPTLGGWQNANAPVQSVAGGQTTVAIKQTAPQAVLTWTTFNVGSKTTVAFDQQGHRTWTAMNAITDPALAPSQILGTVKADGGVYVINPNGVIFGAGSQVNVNSLVAAAAHLSPEQFLTTGIESVYANGTYAPSFTNASGAVLVDAGAQITTAAPSSITDGGGAVLLLGANVANAGSITTPKGQTVLAAGSNFVLRPGYSTKGNQISSTLGTEIASVIPAGVDGNGNPAFAPGGGGVANNLGVISAPLGDITLEGHAVIQAGMALSSTGSSTRGTIHLITSASDPSSSVTLAPGSLTAITVDDSEPALSYSTRAAHIADSVIQDANRATQTPNTVFDDLSRSSDRQDLSRIDVVTGGTAWLQGGASALATGGQIAVSAVSRVQVDTGATIDVSGAHVSLPASANQLAVNIQGFELRDAPVNRDTTKLSNADVVVDITRLLLVPQGTQGYAQDRYYTAGGLLEVGGELANQTHKVGEYLSLGGTITLSTPANGSVVAQPGSVFNLAGGSIDYQAGPIAQSYVQASNGQLYNVNSAPADLSYTGVYQGFLAVHPRWGVTESFATPLLPSTREQAAFSVGRDAGNLILSTPTAVFEGQLNAGVVNGAYQSQSRVGTAQPAGALARSIVNPTDPTATLNLPDDPYLLTQATVAQPGRLTLGQYAYVPDATGTGFHLALSPAASLVSFDANEPPLASSLSSGSTIPLERLNGIRLDAGLISAAGLGGLSVAAGAVVIEAPLTLAAGANLSVAAKTLEVNGDVSVRSGSFNFGALPLDSGSVSPSFVLAANTMIDARGLWTNAKLDPSNLSTLAYANGGSIGLAGNVNLAAGSALDVSAGAGILTNGKTLAGQGGDISLGARLANQPQTEVILNGSLRSFSAAGAAKGGSLVIASSGSVGIGSPSQLTTDLVLAPSMFDSGFANYDIISASNVEVAAGTALAVNAPVLGLTPFSLSAPTGTDPNTALTLVLPSLFAENAASRTLTQRLGASLALSAVGGGTVTIGNASKISVDPLQSFSAARVANSVLLGAGQLTVGDGVHITAPGGNISLIDESYDVENTTNSLWIGRGTVLDVSGLSDTAHDAAGRRYGIAEAGGSILLGSDSHATYHGALEAGSDFIVIRPGAELKAGGASVVIDVPGASGSIAPLTVAADGGSIALSSTSGIYNDGVLSAAAGGAGASGGSLAITLEHPVYASATPAQYNSRILTVGQTAVASGLSDSLLPGVAIPELLVGQARTSVQEITTGGFDSVSLWGRDAIVFDDQGQGSIALAPKRSLTLSKGPIAVLNPGVDVTLKSAHVTLNGLSDIQPNFDAQEYDYPLNGAGLKGTGTLTLNAGLIDIANQVVFGKAEGNSGIVGTSMSGGSLPFPTSLLNAGRAYDGFANIVLNSTGDLRLNSTTDAIGSGISALGNLTLNAAQIYEAELPPSIFAPQASQALAYAATINAGGTLTLRHSTSEVPNAPYSLFGQLSLSAPTIEQGGILRAPSGSISLNGAVVNLLPGSITSVGTDGLVVPIGGTLDGINYRVGGSNAFLDTSSGVLLPGNFLPSSGSISINAKSVAIAAGATVDLSGGGAIAGAGFLSGRGGSVDARVNPLATFVNDVYSAPALAKNPVYAILPGVQGVAPEAAFLDSNAAVSVPGVGQQITIRDGSIPGLAAGTYTLLPGNYALLPGAFRVEIDAVTASATPAALGLNGSYTVTGYQGIANTDILASRPNILTVTPSAVLRTYSSYDETTYDAFALNAAATAKQPRPVVFGDAKALTLNLSGTGLAFVNHGTVLTSAPQDDAGASVTLTAGELEIVNGAATAGFAGSSLDAASLTALNADTLNIGQAFDQLGTPVTNDVYVRAGANFGAAHVDLNAATGIYIDAGGVIDALGFTPKNTAPSAGALVSPLAGFSTITLNAGNRLEIGAGAKLYSDGSITFQTGGALTVDPAALFGTRSVGVSSTYLNIGDAAGISAAAANGTLPAGLIVDSALLQRLLDGSTVQNAGQTQKVPPLQILAFTASNSVNFFGNVDLSTGSLAELDINAPGFYGQGLAGDVASLSTQKLVWNGTGAAPPVIVNGPGSGLGELKVVADDIVFGAGTVLGFAKATFTGKHSTSTLASASGTFTVAQSNHYDDATHAFVNAGGNFAIDTPLLTAASGSVLTISTAGTLTINGYGSTPVDTKSVTTLGGTLTLGGDTIAIDTAVALPSGSLRLVAGNGIALGSDAKIDVSGRSVTFFDVTKYTPGGSVSAQSAAGNITQSAGSIIDVSATQANAGSLAFEAPAGSVKLGGTLSGTAAANFTSGSFSIAADDFGNQSAGDSGFAGLNTALDQGGFTAARSFDLRRGDLTLEGIVKAHTVDISVDAGNLLVNGTINASGFLADRSIDPSGSAPGSIRLAAGQDLTLAPSAVLDASGSVLQVDGYNQPIEASNRGSIELTATGGPVDATGLYASGGKVTLAPGATLNLSTPDASTQYGVLVINAARNSATGDSANVYAPGPLHLSGIKTIALNAFWKYAPLDTYMTQHTATHANYVDQGYLDALSVDSGAFITAALGNGAFADQTKGLRGSAAGFHLRPGVEIDSTADLTISGDLDLSVYRYGPQAHPGAILGQADGSGAGEPGVLALRSAGNINVTGSITDGFNTTGLPAVYASTIAPPRSNDGLYLVGYNAGALARDVYVGGTHGLTLQPGSTFQPGTVLGVDLSIPAVSKLNYLATDPITLAALISTNSPLVGGLFGVDLQAFQLPFDVTVDLTRPVKFAYTTDFGSSFYHVDAKAHTYYVDNGSGPQQLPYPTVLTIPANSSIAADFLSSGSAPVPRPNGTGYNATGFYLGPLTYFDVNGQVQTLTQYVKQSSPALLDKTVLPVPITLASSHVISSDFVATAQVVDATGKLVFKAGQYVDASRSPVTLAAGDRLAVGFTLPSDNNSWTFSNSAITWPAGVPLAFAGGGSDVNTVSNGIAGYYVGASTAQPVLTIPSGGVIPAGTFLAGSITLRNNIKDFEQAPLLAPQTASSSLTLVSGADLTTANPRITLGSSLSGKSGNLTASDPHLFDPTQTDPSASSTHALASFIRTGTGALNLLAGGNIAFQSLYGVYTSGTDTGDSRFYGKVPETASLSGYNVGDGGDVLVSSRGSLVSFATTDVASGSPGSWLWRQAGSSPVTSWGINFAPQSADFGGFGQAGFSGVYRTEGFTGIGALGGGNVTIHAGGDIAYLDAAIGSSGYVLSSSNQPGVGTLVQIGGGNLAIDSGGVFDSLRDTSAYYFHSGTLTNLRGNVMVDVQSFGGSPGDISTPLIGPNLYLGDAVVSLTSRGRFTLNGIGNPTTASESIETKPGGTTASFSTWTDRTAITLTALGGDVTFGGAVGYEYNSNSFLGPLVNAYPNAIPSKLTVLAPAGNLTIAGALPVDNASINSPSAGTPGGFELAPSASGQLELLAAKSIIEQPYLDGLQNYHYVPTAISGADPSLQSSVFHPLAGTFAFQSNVGAVDFFPSNLPLYFTDAVAFGPDTPTDYLHGRDPNAIHIYAVNGDISGLHFGLAYQPQNYLGYDPFLGPQFVPTGQTWYLAAKAAEIRAGGDISNLSTVLFNNPTADYHNPTDISLIKAGGDIFEVQATIFGPGQLVVEAGHNFYQANGSNPLLGGTNSLQSGGLLFGLSGDSVSGGAGISVLAGLGANGPDYASFASVYLDPANLADPNAPLSSQPGKAAHNYSDELVAWMKANYGVTLSAADAVQYFLQLKTGGLDDLQLAQRERFLQQVFFDEVKAGGREYNDPASRRYRSYVRLEDAYNTLFPGIRATDSPYQGSIIEYGTASIVTQFGGDIRTLVPGGQTVLGLVTDSPQTPGGFLTQGSGDIDLFSRDSLLLGQSRIFTTFNGSVLGLSVQGDINAGAGAKTTQIPQALRIVYDDYGNVTLSPTVPATGAGIATLNANPGVAPGDIDLIAPFGVVDAGEAGIRVSGNLNIAALRVANAGNIRVSGKTVGVPTTARVDTGALAAATAAGAAAQDASSIARSANSEFDTVLSVEVVGFGEPSEEQRKKNGWRKGRP